MSALPDLVSAVPENMRVSLVVHLVMRLVVRHHRTISDYLLVDDHGNRHMGQSCLGGFDCRGPKAVGKEVDWEDSVEGCGRT